MRVLIVNESPHAVPRAFVDGWMKALVAELKKRRILKVSHLDRELTLVFLEKRAAKKINHEFRGKDYATDVLSFDSMDPDSFGELVFCPDVLKRQAQEHGLSYKLELGYMLLHGVLHLLGYDHETNEKDAQKMFSLQDAVFEKLLNKI